MATSWMTAGLASRGRRVLSAAVAIVLGAAFLTAVLVGTSTVKRGLEESVAAGIADTDLVVEAGGGGLDPDDAETVEKLDGVTSVDIEAVTMLKGRGEDGVAVSTLPPSGPTLLVGIAPSGLGEAVITPDLQAEGVQIGDSLSLTPYISTGGATPTIGKVQVTGVARAPEGSAVAWGPGLLVSAETLLGLDPEASPQALLVELADGTDLETARAAVSQALPDAVVLPGREAAAMRVAQLSGGVDVMGMMLAGFGAIALATAAIVIANTFTITLAQRSAELALLRCVGATTQQVRKQVLLEALVLGLVASLVGVAVGLGAAALLLEWGRRAEVAMPLGAGLSVTPLAVLLPVAAGVLTTVLASLWPAIRATRVSPLAALHPEPAVRASSRGGLVRSAVGLLLLIGGVTLMINQAGQRALPLAVLGGMLSFVGVLVASVVVVPAAVRALGLPARLAGVPGRLAVDNAVRNPGRAAATSAALLVGVTLVTMTTAGAATGERTAMGEIDDAYAADLVVTAPETSDSLGQLPDQARPGHLPPATLGRLEAVEGVEAASSVEAAYLRLGRQDGSSLMLGFDEGERATVRSSDQLDDLQPGTIGMGNLLQAVHGLEPGDRVEVSGPGGSSELTVVELGMGEAPVLAAADLRALAGPAVVKDTVMIVRAHDVSSSDGVRVVSEGVDEALDGLDARLSGSLAERTMITRVLDTMVIVALAMLGVAVLIAVVGITNTLSLSVLERQRENALLRGLGLTRGQLRSMLLAEGVLLALVSTAIGVALGLLYARYGIETIVPEETAVRLAVPWGRVAAISGVALGAGLLASVVPAQRAARTAPAQGLVAV